MKKTKKQNSRQVNKVNNQPQPIKKMEKVENQVVVTEVPSSEFEQPTAMVDEQQKEPMRISDLHLSKVHDVYQKGMQVNQIAADIYQREFALKEDKKQLDELNQEYLKEENKISNELAQVYRGIDFKTLNHQTGEYKHKN